MARFSLFSRSLLFFSLCFLVSIPALSSFQDTNDQDTVPWQKKQQPVYTTIRLSSTRPVIDGKLDDDCWKNGTWAGDYHQWIPVEGAKPTWPTVFNIQYDDK
ncbi:MAG: hypothetical protein NTW82_01885, partial [Bacteroidia bacterium]|nr:hypothetical protein [Bacteroidia bacterium]